MKIQAKFRTLWLSFHFCVAVWKTAGSRNTVTDPETGAEWCSMSSTFSPVFIFLLAENSFRERVTALCRQVRQKRTRKVRGKEQMGEKLRGFSVCRLLRGSCRSVVGTVPLVVVYPCHECVCVSRTSNALTLTPQRCVCVSESATGHHPHPTLPPSVASLPSHWSRNW